MDYKKIFLNEITDEGLTLNVTLAKEEFELQVDNNRIADGLSFKGILQRISGQYILSGELQSVWIASCDRCLEEFHLPVKTQVLLRYVDSSKAPSGSTYTSNNPVDEPDEIVEEYIDMYKVFTEQLILQIPMKALCSDSCKGLCSNCGQDLNKKECGCDRRVVDPRLSKLKNYFKK